MTVLVDTSVWADFFNGYSSPEADALASLLRNEADLATCGLILAEFFQGLRGRTQIERLRTQFDDLRLLTPSEPATYFRAAGLFRDLRSKGVTVRSTVDCIIAILAAEHGTALLAKDRDMIAIARSGLCNLQLVQP